MSAQGVSPDWAAVAAMSAALALLLTLLKLAQTYGERLTAAKNRADSAMIVASEAKAKAEVAEANLAKFKEEVARTYVTGETIARVEARLVAAIERIGDRFDRWADGKGA